MITAAKAINFFFMFLAPYIFLVLIIAIPISFIQKLKKNYSFASVSQNGLYCYYSTACRTGVTKLLQKKRINVTIINNDV